MTRRGVAARCCVMLIQGAFGIRVPGDGAVYLVDSSRDLLIFNEP